MNGSVLLGGVALLIMWGTWGVIAKLALREIGMQVMIWSQVVSLAMFPLYFVLFNDMLPVKLTSPGIFWGMLAGALGTGGAIVVYLLLRTAPANIVIPISALYPVVTVIVAYLFLNETLSSMKLVGLALAVTAIWLLSN